MYPSFAADRLSGLPIAVGARERSDDFATRFTHVILIQRQAQELVVQDVQRLRTSLIVCRRRLNVDRLRTIQQIVVQSANAEDRRLGLGFNRDASWHAGFRRITALQIYDES